VRQPRRGLDPRLFRQSQRIDSTWWHWWVNVLAASPAVSRERRSRMLARAGLDVGRSIIESGCYFFGHQIRIGAWTVANHRCYFDTRDWIEIGQTCSLGMEVMFCTSTHHLGDHLKRAGAYRTGPISVGDGTWLGTRTTVLPGVTIGASSIVAAGAVVVGDVPDNVLYAGVPARKVRDLEPG
jgi:maltose O-acetyltransferase